MKNREEKLKSLIQNNFQPLEHEFEDKRPPSRYWATWIKKVYQVDPMICRKCGGELKIKAFLHDSKRIKKLCNNLGINHWRAPPGFQNTKRYIDTSPEFAQ